MTPPALLSLSLLLSLFLLGACAPSPQQLRPAQSQSQSHTQSLSPEDLQWEGGDSLTHSLTHTDTNTNADTELYGLEQEQELEQEQDEGFSPSVPSSADVVYSHFKRAVRYLTGSNCVFIERGEVPIYEQCYGCSMREAFACLQDMRNNITGNVAPGCTIAAISEKADTSCCPEFVKFSDGTFGPVLFESSAYPMALECLREVGCEDTEIFTNLLAECYHVCDGVKNRYNNDIFFTCTAIPSPAALHSPSVLLASASFALLLALQVLY